MPSKRKPDIVITSLAAAQRAVEDPDLLWDVAAERYASKRPKKPFKWGDILLCLKLKRVKHNITPPSMNATGGWPDVVRYMLIEPVAPATSILGEDYVFVSSNGEEKRRKLDVPSSSHSQPIDSADAKPAPSRRVTRSTTLEPLPGQAIPHRLQLSTSSKRKREGSPAVGQKDPHPIIQCAMYGTEMISCCSGAYHAINLLIVGMFPRSYLICLNI